MITDDDRKLKITKVLHAPIEQVWEVWTKPEHIKHWWGPTGFTNTIQQMNFKVNGEWIFTMHGPDGKNYPNRIMFQEIIPFKKIVFKHFNPNYIATINFESKGKEIALEWITLFETKELFDTVVKVFKADEGMKQNVERLEHYLSK